jgi:hypothetical protein
METLLHLSQGPVFSSSPPTEFFKNPLLPGFPVFPAPLFQNTIKLFLSFLSPFFDGGYQVLLVSMSEKTGQVCVLERLEGGKGRGSVKVGY